jgi:hypothetical protein
VTGLPDGVTVEIEFTASVWTDVTTYVSAESKVSVRAGRTTEFDDVGPSTCTLVLRNDDGRFTPDSAGSPYYPDVIEGRRIRVTVTESAVDYPLFTGSILSWEPNYAGGMLSNGTVTVTANDALATLALHTFDSRWVEETRALARTAATWVDIYALKGDASTAAWDNIGLSTVGADPGTAILVPATAAVGEVSYGTPASLILDGSAEFKPSTEVGTVVTVTPAAAPEAVSFWLQVPTGTLPTSTDYVLQVRAGGTEVVSIRLVNSGGTCNLTAVGTFGLLGTLASGVADAAWRLISITQSGSDIAVTSTTTAGAVTALTGAGLDLTTCTRMLLGAEIDDGAPNLAASMLVAGLSVAGDATVVPSYLRALPGQTYLHTALYSSFQTYVPEVTTWATTGGEVRTVGEPVWAGQTALSVLQTIARTINGVAYVDGSGNVTLAAADIVRPGVSAASLDIEQDLDATAAMPTLRRASDSRPTRVTIGYAGGTTTLVDTAAEANNQPRREVKLETCAADVAGATFAGSYVLQATNGLRITQVAVDLTTSVTNLWATFLGPVPHAEGDDQRLRRRPDRRGHEGRLRPGLAGRHRPRVPRLHPGLLPGVGVRHRLMGCGRRVRALVGRHHDDRHRRDRDRDRQQRHPRHHHDRHHRDLDDRPGDVPAVPGLGRRDRPDRSGTVGVDITADGDHHGAGSARDGSPHEPHRRGKCRALPRGCLRLLDHEG